MWAGGRGRRREERVSAPIVPAMADSSNPFALYMKPLECRFDPSSSDNPNDDLP